MKNSLNRLTASLHIVLMLLLCLGSTPTLATTANDGILKTQTGKASWYGPGFHGHKTASGQRFDQNALTAAHPSLPLGSVAQVTNLENGRTVKVAINDRGPARRIQRRGVIVDLSLGAAKQLGFVNQGKTRVKIEVLQMGKRRQS